MCLIERSVRRTNKPLLPLPACCHAEAPQPASLPVKARALQIRAAGSARSAERLPPALLIPLHRLECVVGHVVPVAAVLRRVDAEGLGVVSHVHAEEIHASTEVAVLAAIEDVPWRLADSLVGAADVGVVVGVVDVHGAPA
eukprot:UN3855